MGFEGFGISGFECSQTPLPGRIQKVDPPTWDPNY